jgi:hypothetical protein
MDVLASRVCRRLRATSLAVHGNPPSRVVWSRTWQPAAAGFGIHVRQLIRLFTFQLSVDSKCS